MPSPSGLTRFQREVRPLLVSAYESGRLVPFLGAGMSYPACPLWDRFLANLERAAGQRAPHASRGNPAARAHLAGVTLRNRLDTGEYRRCLRAALAATAPSAIPPQTRALARIWWPLVITTNYDDLFLTAVTRQSDARAQRRSPAERRLPRQPMTVVGRHPQDCRRVLGSLYEPMVALDNLPLREAPGPRGASAQAAAETAAAAGVSPGAALAADTGSYLWHIQGFLGGQADPDGTPERWADRHDGQAGLLSPLRLLDDLVLGHAEYRRVINAEIHFRRCFGEVFRQRSLLFLGSSLSEDYFLNLFGETIELYGASSFPHFAFVKRGSVDARFLLERMNILICEYDDHADLPAWIDSLRQAIQGDRCRPTRWSFSVRSPFRITPPRNQGDFAVVRSSLPFLARIPKDECVAVSSGRGPKGAPWIGPEVRVTYLQQQIPAARLDKLLAASPLPAGGYVARLGKRACYVVAARDPKRQGRQARSLEHVHPAVRSLLDRAWRDGFRAVHLQLLAAGRLQIFPPTFSLIETARAYGRWRRRHPSRELRLCVYVLDPLVLFNVSTGRTPLQELLSVDAARFWLEVIGGSPQVVRIPVQLDGQTPLREILALCRVPQNDDWQVRVRPAPCRPEPGEARDTRALAGETLTALGVVPGSTLVLADTRQGGPRSGIR